jgi:hypothetical protein
VKRFPLFASLFLFPLFCLAQKTDAELSTQLNALIPNNTTRIISPLDVRTVVQDGYDAKISIYGNMGIKGMLGYNTHPTFTNDKQIVDKKYVDDKFSAIASSVISFKDRTGAVVPTNGDYTFSMIGAKPNSITGYGIIPSFSDYAAFYYPLTANPAGYISLAQSRAGLSAPGPFFNYNPSTGLLGINYTPENQALKNSTGTMGNSNSVYVSEFTVRSWVNSLGFYSGGAPVTSETDPVFTANGVFLAGSYSNPSFLNSLAWSKITGAPAFLTSFAESDPLAVKLAGSYSNPSFINSLAYSKLTGAPTNLSSFSNGPGYLTSFTELDPLSVKLAGSYSNPSFITSLVWSKITGAPSFLTSFTETDPLAVKLSGSYANPSWISSLVWSKITGAPSFLTSYTETDPLAVKLATVYSNPSFVGSLPYTKLTGTPDLSLKQNTISIPANSLMGRYSTGSGTYQTISLSSDFSIVGGVLVSTGSTGGGTGGTDTFTLVVSLPLYFTNGTPDILVDGSGNVLLSAEGDTLYGENASTGRYVGIRNATHTTRGVMTAADKVTLDSLKAAAPSITPGSKVDITVVDQTNWQINANAVGTSEIADGSVQPGDIQNVGSAGQGNLITFNTKGQETARVMMPYLTRDSIHAQTPATNENIIDSVVVAAPLRKVVGGALLNNNGTAILNNDNTPILNSIREYLTLDQVTHLQPGYSTAADKISLDSLKFARNIPLSGTTLGHPVSGDIKMGATIQLASTSGNSLQMDDGAGVIDLSSLNGFHVDAGNSGSSGQESYISANTVSNPDNISISSDSITFLTSATGGVNIGYYLAGNFIKLLADPATAPYTIKFPSAAPAANTIFKYNGTHYVWAAESTGTTIADGNKGDITTSGSATTWTINNNAVNSAKIADGSVANTDLANSSISFTTPGSSGSAPNWSNSSVPLGGGQTFNIPLADVSVTSGTISNTAQSLYGNKTFLGTTTLQNSTPLVENYGNLAYTDFNFLEAMTSGTGSIAFTGIYDIPANSISIVNLTIIGKIPNSTDFMVDKTTFVIQQGSGSSTTTILNQTHDTGYPYKTTGFPTITNPTIDTFSSGIGLTLTRHSTAAITYTAHFSAHLNKN